jgi:redox-sensitive bicupin YhaK (pirin superfamily)
MSDPYSNDPVETVIVPPVRDLGDGFTVRRALPSVGHRMVGPFVFFDRMGPVDLAPGQGLDVRPHPHIGLATVTYVLQGEILHRDSLGSVQPIRPGAVNWMTAGRGIVHSERTAPEVRAAGGTLSALQIWVALPEAHEETDPAFVHHPAETIPAFDGEGIQGRLVVGAGEGVRSPVETFSDMLYADVVMAPGARYPVPRLPEERAFYVLSGTAGIAGRTESFPTGELVVLKPGADLVVDAPQGARIVLFGGEPLGPRHLYWNFVSSSKDRIEQAKADWRAGRFAGVPGETDFIPLPGDPPPPPTPDYP